MSRLEELILFILDRAKNFGIKDLSEFQLFKIPYLIQCLSLKYAGTFFVPDITFVRDKNGPISIDIYTAIEKLIASGYVKKEIIENKKYGHPRYAHSLSGKLPKLSLNTGETIFLDNFLAKLLLLSQVRLREIAYKTEPMQEIQKMERDGKIKKGVLINFSSVTVDPDIVEAYSDVQ